MRGARVFVLAAMLVAGLACEREQRSFETNPAQRGVSLARDSGLVPGGPVSITPPTENRHGSTNPYKGNAYAISQGEQLFSWYNCAGCHGHGGGAIGPSLMQKKLKYGNSPSDIFQSISRGRPNGMPAWGNRIPESQIWQLVAYVRSLSGNQPRSATPPRTDEMEPNPETILHRRPPR